MRLQPVTLGFWKLMLYFFNIFRYMAEVYNSESKVTLCHLCNPDSKLAYALPRFADSQLAADRLSLRTILSLFAVTFSFFLMEMPTMAQHQKQVIVPETMQESYDNFKFAPAVRAGDMLYLSGVVVTLKDGETTENITPAVERAFDQIELVLKEAGASWSDVVDVTSYAIDLDRDMGPMWAVKEKRVPAPHPAWTAVGTTRLFGGDNALIEIKVTAYLPKN